MPPPPESGNPVAAGPQWGREELAGDGEVVARAGAVAGAFERVVRPQALDGVLLAVVARDVVQPAGDGRGARDPLRVADPGALVAVLVGGVVVPAPEDPAVDH